MQKIILASSSPRRRDILEKTGLEFEVIQSDYEETFENADFTYEKIETLAFNKANAVLNKINVHAIVIGADTVVVLNGKILGKPQNKEDAINMLKQLSGKRHSIVTSVCVINSKNLEKKILSTTSFVEFEVLNDDLIKSYVANYKTIWIKPVLMEYKNYPKVL
jgi:MAF protein